MKFIIINILIILLLLILIYLLIYLKNDLLQFVLNLNFYARYHLKHLSE